MLESISARGWRKVSLFVLVGACACIAVVVIGHRYGSELRACGSAPSPFAQHRQWPVPAADWVLFIVALGLVCAFIIVLIITFVRGRDTLSTLVDYLSHPLVWLGGAFFVGGEVGWIFIEQVGWTC